MDTLYNTFLDSNDKVFTAQLHNQNVDCYDSLNDYEYSPDLDTVKWEEGSYCPLPPYCLIEDKHKYIHD
jgi:hypothetical protein